MVGGINRNSYLYYCQRKTNYIYSVNRHFLLPKRPAWPTSLLPWIIYLTLAFSLEQDLLSTLSKSIFDNLFRVAMADSPKRLWWYHWICWTLSAVGIFCILLAHDHYTVDVVVAYFITTRLFWWYHTLANQQVSSASISNLRARPHGAVFWLKRRCFASFWPIVHTNPVNASHENGVFWNQVPGWINSETHPLSVRLDGQNAYLRFDDVIATPLERNLLYTALKLFVHAPASSSPFPVNF